MSNEHWATIAEYIKHGLLPVGAVEVRELRTDSARTYDIGGGKRVVLLDPTLTIQPSDADSILNKQYPTTNEGSSTVILLYDRNIYIRRIILKFDFSAELPEGASIDSASLRLYCHSIDSQSIGRTIHAYRVTQIEWVESEVTWNQYKSGSNWSSVGGDYITTDGASTTGALGWREWGVTAQVQYAQANVSKVAHFLMRYANENQSSYGVTRFHSQDYADDVSLRPKLSITYTVAADQSYSFIM